jgi:leucyl-tRNA synthetase
VQSYAFKNSAGVLVPVDEVVEQEDGTFQAKETGETVERLTAKMSKSLKNVINPDDVITQYGADTMRLYEAFMGPVTASAPWNPRDLPGVFRFLQRTWRVFDLGIGTEGNADVERAMHRCIKKVGSDLEQMGYNTAIAGMMEFINTATKVKQPLTAGQARNFCILLEPFAPHLAEQLWADTKQSGELAYAPWPQFDESKLVSDTIEVPVQINGKLRGRATVAADASRDDLEAAAREVIADQLEGEIRKVIVVPGRMVNFVVTG